MYKQTNQDSRIEHGSFTSIVLSATGGMAEKATMFYKRLASLLATKWNDDYGKVMGWLRCCLSFSLLRSAIACVRGDSSSIGHIYRASPSLDVICVESHLNINDQQTVYVTLLYSLVQHYCQHCWGW